MKTSQRQARRHGYIVIDKPAGATSHDVVAAVRRIVGERRVGHAGTLDPAAVGVLPIAVGLATRTVEYLADASKGYRAGITFGIETDSADGDGRVLAMRDPVHLREAAVRELLSRFLGDSMQRPPALSAIKVGGRRLYDLARQGTPVNPEARPVSFHRLGVLDWTSPVLTVDIECSKGTYIRSLARDLGIAAGTGAYLSHLVRTRSGPFTLHDAVALAVLPDAIAARGWSELAFHPDWALLDRDSVVLSPEHVARWRSGLDVPIVGRVPGPVRVYDDSGCWIGVGQAEPECGSTRPRKVVSISMEHSEP